MGKEARIGLLLGASACLLAVMVDWVVEELAARKSQFPAQELAHRGPGRAGCAVRKRLCGRSSALEVT